MRFWVRRYSIQTPRLTVQRRSIVTLAEGEEPRVTGSETDDRGGGVPRTVSVRHGLIECAFYRAALLRNRLVPVPGARTLFDRLRCSLGIEGSEVGGIPS